MGKRFGRRRARLGPHTRKAQMSVVCRPRLQEFVEPDNKLAASRRTHTTGRLACAWRRNSLCQNTFRFQAAEPPPRRTQTKARKRRALGRNRRMPPVAASLPAQRELRRLGVAEHAGGKAARAAPGCSAARCRRKRDSEGTGRPQAARPRPRWLPRAMRAKRNPVRQGDRAAQAPVPIRLSALTLYGRSPQIVRPASR